MRGHFAVPRKRADANGVAALFDLRQRQAGDIDQVGGLLRARLHQVDQIGAPAQKPGFGVAMLLRDRLADILRARIAEASHPRCSTDRIAATIFG